MGAALPQCQSCRRSREPAVPRAPLRSCLLRARLYRDSSLAGAPSLPSSSRLSRHHRPSASTSAVFASVCIDLPSRSMGLHCSTTHRSSPVSSTPETSPPKRDVRRACAASSFSLVNEPPPTWRVSSLLLAWCGHALHTELLHATCYCSALFCCACGLLACVRAVCWLCLLACRG
jgi:hypothetical protein